MMHMIDKNRAFFNRDKACQSYKFGKNLVNWKIQPAEFLKIVLPVNKMFTPMFPVTLLNSIR